jgi:Ca2+-binding RTX toxin-like protein
MADLQFRPLLAPTGSLLDVDADLDRDLLTAKKTDRLGAIRAIAQASANAGSVGQQAKEQVSSGADPMENRPSKDILASTVVLPKWSAGSLNWPTTDLSTKNHRNQHEDDHEDKDDHDHTDPFPTSNGNGLAPAGIVNNNSTLGDAINLTTFDLGKVFKLHSNPNATKTIYLDFDGATISNTLWNNSTTPQIIAQAYDTDGNVGVFSNTELQTIVALWQQISEDFAPFEVNVTTEAPPSDDLRKFGVGDTRWGIHVMMTQNINTANNAAIYANAGGVAYVNSFNYSTETPAFVFNKGELNGAMTASHEIGHAMGLSHDGQLDSNPNDTVNDAKGYSSGYGTGATSWGAIMGAPFGKNLTQWSKGEYQLASNQEDDLNIITTKNGFGYQSDDYGNDFGTSSRLLSNGSNKISAFGTIEQNTDQDVFSFVTGTGNISLNVLAASRSYLSDGLGNYNLQYLAARGSNLDIWAGIYSADGTLVAESNPTDLLTASFSNLFLNSGLYYLKVDGVGKSGVDGYSDYGSLGQYAIDGTLTTFGTTNSAPILVNPLADLTVSSDAALTLTLPANAFVDSDPGDILTYRATLADGSALPAWLTFDQATKTFRGTPLTGDVGAIDVQVLVTDSAGAQVSDIFKLTINKGFTQIDGDSANNSLTGTIKDDYIRGFAGNDTLSGLDGVDTLEGGLGDDYLDGGAGIDRLVGGDGNDTYRMSQVDLIIEDANGGIDTVISDVSYSLVANLENLSLYNSTDGTGNSDNNRIIGLGTGNNRLAGGDGNDYLEGGLGNDTLTGGTGTDSFVLNGTGKGLDQIVDFAAGVDKILVSSGTFGGGLVAGAALLSKQLLVGTGSRANTVDQRFIYNKNNGSLFFDADGNKTQFSSIKVATLSNLAAISASDFVLV